MKVVYKSEIDNREFDTKEQCESHEETIEVKKKIQDVITKNKGDYDEGLDWTYDLACIVYDSIEEINKCIE